MSGIFPPDIIAAAQAADRKWKVPASVSLAQWALESSWGSRNMGLANNCFGLKPWKAGQKTVLVDTHEVENGISVPVKAKFCSFETIADCFDAHGEFLVRNSRYKPAFVTADGIAFARAVAKAGYATDPKYADKLVDLITRYGLMRFDGARIAIEREPAPAAPKPSKAATGTAAAGAVVVAAGSTAVASGGHSAAIAVGALAVLALIVFLTLHFRKKT